MNVILLEKIRNLGNLGDQVAVKPGYGRNYLIPTGRAVPATATNIEKFEARRSELEKAAIENLKAAQVRADKLTNAVVVVKAKAGDEGKLYGSVGTSDIAMAVNQTGVEVKKSEVRLPTGPLRLLGEYDISLQLHSDVSVTIKVQIVPEE